MSLPTLLVFRRGEVVGSIVGARPKAHLRQALSAHAEL
jgi:thioredoxin 1